LNHYQDKNHQIVSEHIKNIKNIHWIVSYDNVDEIKALYLDCPKKEYSFKHTAHSARVGQEILFFSPTIKQPDISNWNPLSFKFRKTKTTSKIIYKSIS
jgi:DNA adenine methylase